MVGGAVAHPSPSADLDSYGEGGVKYGWLGIE